MNPWNCIRSVYDVQETSVWCNWIEIQGRSNVVCYENVERVSNWIYAQLLHFKQYCRSNLFQLIYLSAEPCLITLWMHYFTYGMKNKERNITSRLSFYSFWNIIRLSDTFSFKLLLSFVIKPWIPAQMI